jgi:hypothetical protein
MMASLVFLRLRAVHFENNRAAQPMVHDPGWAALLHNRLFVCLFLAANPFLGHRHAEN